MAPTLQGAKWIKVDQKEGEGPGPRCSHAIAMVRDKLYSFGGELTPNVSIDKHLYVFDFKTRTWSIALARGNVPRISCFGVRMVAVGTKLYVFGGRDAKRDTEDFYSYDTVTNTWKLLTKLDQEGGPEARGFPSMASDETHVYVFGGVSKGDRQNPPGRFKTTWVYNIDDGKWVKLPEPDESFEKRGGAGLAVVDKKIWVFYGLAGTMMAGGKKNEHECSTVHYFDQASKKWIEVNTTGAKPSARSVFAHAVVGKYIIMFGGEVTPDPKAHLFPGMLSNEGFALNTETLVWEKFGGGDEPAKLGWSAFTSATVDGKQGLLMHGGKVMSNGRTDDLYFYALNSA